MVHQTISVELNFHRKKHVQRNLASSQHLYRNTTQAQAQQYVNAAVNSPKPKAQSLVETAA
jgi:hypothetical protein